MEQEQLFGIDTVGRKASKLGLSPDNEIAILVLEEAERFHRAFANYQIGLVSVEMEKLTGSAKSDTLSRLWVDTFTSFTNLGNVLQKWGPTDAALDNQIAADIAAEKLAAGETVETDKMDKIDDELKKLMDGGMPKADEDDDEDEA